MTGVGALLATVLTAGPAALVLWAKLSPRVLLAPVLLLALLQVAVHLRCFLNLSRKKPRANRAARHHGLDHRADDQGTLAVLFDQMQRM
ncbi:hypothetical protein EWW49_25990 [Pseudomonas syringae]|uniref:cytochrome C oxidase subunit IV family protein n=1 Tax=Pseudomonas sp. MWU16-30316 TaxID=2878093 RepID=UPI00110283F0|nr:cytochrome C oxidase subunit IV family protein [Pseudomonas sp. MWU16-30316]TFZ34280.1 hypothetical protein EWW49_25990 [Pseudomonas syringae]